MTNEQVAEKLKTLPTRPGVYLYRDARDAIIYVGKAKNLKARVSQYFLRASEEPVIRFFRISPLSVPFRQERPSL